MRKTIKYKYTKISFLLSVLLSLFTSIQLLWKTEEGKHNPYIIISDGIGYYMYLKSIFIDNDIKSLSPDDRFIFKTENNRAVIRYFAGPAIFISPFFASAHLLCKPLGYVRNGFSYPYQIAVSMASIFYFSLGLLFLVKLLILYRFSDLIIAVSALITVSGTNLLNYAALEPSMSHIYSFFAINLFAFSTKKFILNNQLKFFFICCFALGLIIIIRPFNVLIIMLIPFLAGNYDNFRNLLKSILQPSIIPGIILTFLIIFLQLFLWYIQTGTWIVKSYENNGFYWLNPAITDVLFSFRKGFFIYTPIAFVALLGFILLYRKNKFEFYSLLLFLILLIYFISAWWNWYYGPSFSQRPFVEFMLIFAILISFLLTYRFSKALLTLCAALMCLNLIQTYQYHRQIISSWDMNYEKYKAVFLKTNLLYQYLLGGNNDMPPFPAEQQLIYATLNTYENEMPYWTTYNTKSTEDSSNIFCDYSALEFNTAFLYTLSKPEIINRSIYLNIKLDRYEITSLAASLSLVVMTLSDVSGEIYYYKRFRINETPFNPLKQWKTYEYNVDLPKIKNTNDKLHVYIWNKEKKSFYIDNFKIKIRLNKY